MHPRLLAQADAQRGPFTAAQALAHGMDRDEIRRLLTSGRLVRLRRGVYVESWRIREGDHDSHRLAIDGLLLVLTPRAVISHESAAVLHGLDLLEPDLGRLHVTRPDLGSSRIEAGVRHHAAALPDADVVVRDGRRVTSLERTSVDLARHADLRSAVVAIDSGLRAGARIERVREVLFACSSWRGARTAGRAVSLADARSESVGESLCRLLLAQLGLPTPRAQVDITDADGFVARVDLLFHEQATVVEFDGRVKYADAGSAGSSDVLWREKRREDRIRALGFEVVRLVWADLQRPEAVRGRILAAFRRSGRAGGVQVPGDGGAVA